MAKNQAADAGEGRHATSARELVVPREATGIPCGYFVEDPCLGRDEFVRLTRDGDGLYGGCDVVGLA